MSGGGRTAPAELLDWDSTFWGVRIGRVTGNILDEGRRAELDDWAQVNDVECLLLPRILRPSGHGAHRAGGRLRARRHPRRALTAVDRRRDDDGRSRIPVGGSRRAQGDRADTPREHALLRRRQLPPAALRRSLRRLDHAKLRRGVGRRRPRRRDSRPTEGYVTLELEPEARRASIGLIAVSAAAAGHGVGGELVAGAHAWCRARDAESLSVVTQGSNVAAQRLFQRMGLRTVSTGLWFHRWYAR